MSKQSHLPFKPGPFYEQLTSRAVLSGLTLSLLLISSLAASCARNYSWTELYTHQSAHYTIHTDSSPETAQNLAETIESATSAVCSLLHCTYPLPRFVVYAYSSQHHYEAVASRFSLSPGTTGFYNPQSPEAIHFPLQNSADNSPLITLSHEVVHQIIDQVLRYTLPEEAQLQLPAKNKQLMSVPLWLNEGLASYLETIRLDEGSVVFDKARTHRLRQLQQLIRTNRCPSLGSVLSSPYGGSFSPADYAVAWGLIYTLRHPAAPEAIEPRRHKLDHYLDAAKNAFFSAEELQDFCISLNREHHTDPFHLVWHQRLAKRSLEVFQEIVLPPGTSLEAWEKSWQQEILSLAI